MNLLKAINRSKQIISGIYRSFFPDIKIELVAAKRLLICNKCVMFDEKGTECFVPGTQPCCGECGCKLQWKIRCMDCECGLGLWGKETFKTKNNENT